MAIVNTQELKDVTANGLWKQNSTLVQILGMCPVLAITTTMVTATLMLMGTLMTVTMPMNTIMTMPLTAI